jgi:hypothetical protein
MTLPVAGLFNTLLKKASAAGRTPPAETSRVEQIDRALALNCEISNF